jgi:replicative DNA helicase
LSHIQDKSDDIRLYLQALAGQVTDRYHVYDVDEPTIRHWAEIIDKVGSAYALMAKASDIADGLSNQDRFEKEVLHIDDIDGWANTKLAAFRNTLKVSTGGLQHISVAANNVQEIWNRKRRGEQMTFLPSGMPSLIGAGFFAAGDLTVVHGLSGAGKSALVHQSDLGIAIGLRMNNIPGCVAEFSLEMPQERLTGRFAALLAGVDTSKLNYLDGLSDEDFNRLSKWLEFVATLPVYIDQTNFLTTSAMQFATEGLHTSEWGPVRKCSADYIELFDSDKGDNKEQKLDHIIHEHLRLARVTGANVTIISQTTYSGESKTIYPAGPGGPRYSKAIQHAADSIMEVWNPLYMKAAGMKYAQIEGVSEHHVTLFVQKCRYGSLGSVRLNWNPECTQYTDPLVRSDLVFDHLKEVTESINGTSAKVVAIRDTSFGDF